MKSHFAATVRVLSRLFLSTMSNKKHQLLKRRPGLIMAPLRSWVLRISQMKFRVRSRLYRHQLRLLGLQTRLLSHQSNEPSSCKVPDALDNAGSNENTETSFAFCDGCLGNPQRNVSPSWKRTLPLPLPLFMSVKPVSHQTVCLQL